MPCPSADPKIFWRNQKLHCIQWHSKKLDTGTICKSILGLAQKHLAQPKIFLYLQKDEALLPLLTKFQNIWYHFKIGKVEIFLEQRGVAFLSLSKICENLNFSTVHPEKFKFLQILLGDKNTTSLSSKIISTLVIMFDRQL